MTSFLGQHQYPNRYRADFDDVSAARPCALRGTAARVRGQTRAGNFADPELDYRAGTDVCARGDLSFGQA